MKGPYEGSHQTKLFAFGIWFCVGFFQICTVLILKICVWHQRQQPFLVAHKTYTKSSTFVKYVIKLVGTANPIADSKFVEEYVMNNKANQIF